MKKTFKQISKWDLNKYDWYKCEFVTQNWYKIKDAEVHVENDTVHIVSNDINANWLWYTKEWFKYSWIIYDFYDNDEDCNNFNHKEITILWIEETFKLWEQVAVNDESEERAIIDLESDECKYFYTWWISKKWEYIIEQCSWKIFAWKFIAKIPTTKTIKIKSEDWEVVEIDEDKAKDLWFKIN